MNCCTDPVGALNRYFGFDSFLDYQREIIDRIVSGTELCVIMPTGAGKSLCYQLPALLKPGYSIVASPLIALMKDQVDSLVSRGIPAACVNSTVSFSEQRAALDGAAAGEVKLLYVAPERFRTEFFRDFLHRCPPSLLVVDEAHCISQWGHDFRPAYLRLGEAAAEFDIPQICAFTATATPTVRDDIRRQLQRDEMEFFVAGFKRPNLAFKVRNCRGDGEKRDALRDLLAEPAPTIIYAATRQAVDDIAARFGVIAYHAGMSDADREAAQEKFMNDPAPVLVATNAFGMGIDRADVRKVIHYHLPGSIEAYYQEAGRAGRDGKAAECILLFSFADRYIQQFLIDLNNPPAEVVRSLYRRLRSEAGRAGTTRLEIPVKKLAAALPDAKSDGQISTALGILEKGGLLERDFHRTSGGTLRFLAPPERLRMIHQEEKTQRSRFLARCAKRYGETLTGGLECSIGALAETAGLSEEQVRRVLGALNGDSISWQPGFSGRAITLLHPEIAEPELDAEEIEAKREAETARLDEVVTYAQSRRCRQAELISYFGEDVSSWRCGCCDLCGDRAEFTREAEGDEAHTVRSILVAAAHRSGRIGANKLAKILVGGADPSLDGDEPDFAVLGSMKATRVTALIQSLERDGCLDRIDRNGYPCLRLTGRGKRVIAGETPARLDVPPEKSSSRKRKALKAGPREETLRSDLYERLRQLRYRLAKAQSVPPFVLLTNRELEDLAELKPLTAQEALGIKGIGPHKAEAVLPPFLEEIQNYLRSGEK